MYKFAVCDDDTKDLEIIEMMFKEFLVEFNINNYIMDIYESGYELLESASNYDLILLDILLTDIDGISIARKFIENNKEQNIIFISSSNAYLKEGYRVKALRYITKPIDKKELFYDLKIVLKNLIENNLFIYDELQTGVKLYYKNIEYIEVIGRNTYIHYKGTKRNSKKTLKKWEEILNENHFVRSHNSFLVNLKHVYYIKNNQIILKSGNTVPLSRTYKNNFKNLLFDYLGDLK